MSTIRLTNYQHFNDAMYENIELPNNPNNTKIFNIFHFLMGETQNKLIL